VDNECIDVDGNRGERGATTAISKGSTDQTRPYQMWASTAIS